MVLNAVSHGTDGVLGATGSCSFRCCTAFSSASHLGSDRQSCQIRSVPRPPEYPCTGRSVRLPPADPESGKYAYGQAPPHANIHHPLSLPEACWSSSTFRRSPSQTATSERD